MASTKLSDSKAVDDCEFRYMFPSLPAEIFIRIDAVDP